MNKVALQNNYLKLVNEAVAVRQPYEEEGKVMPKDIIDQVKKLLDEADDIDEQIKNLDDALKTGERLNRAQELAEQPASSLQHPSAKANPDNEGHSLAHKGFNAWVKGGNHMLANDAHAGIKEFKALQADSDVLGGYVIAPREVVTELIKNIDDEVFIRGFARVFTLDQGQSLGSPVLEKDISDPVWTSELQTGDEDDTEPFGRRELNPQPLAKRFKISNKMLGAPGLDVEAFWRERLAYKFAVAQENNFLTGNGANQPLGLLTPSRDGISTARDVTEGNTATGITAVGLVNAQYSLKAAYWGRSRWVFHRDALKQIRLLQLSDNQFIWQPGLQAGQPDRILDMPFTMSEFMPNTFTTGKYVGILGDFSKYWIADALNFQVQRLVELYAENNQVGFIGRLECDAAPSLEEAFVRVKLA